VSPRRIEFRIACLRQGRKIYDVAADLGVSYQHLIMVLDAKRTGSASLEAGIAQVVRATQGSDLDMGLDRGLESDLVSNPESNPESGVIDRDRMIPERV
jgi:hypothetical protein